MEQLVKSNAPGPQRRVPHVPVPRPRRLPLEELLEGEKIKVDVLREHFEAEGRLTEDAAKYIVSKATVLFRSRQNIVKIRGPTIIVGDIHGQFFDLLTIFNMSGMPPAVRYVFLGDYVNRGVFGCEVLLYLYALKINFPRKVVLLRGNHESRTMTSAFNFRLEAQKKYSHNMYLRFLKSFRALQLAAIIGSHYFCVHGGISPYLLTLKAILKLDRDVEPEDSAALSDLLWADPRVDPTHRVREFVPNTARRTSYFYGRLAAENFLTTNGLLTIVRGHEVKEEGFEVTTPSSARRAPVVITVFSAPNYIGAYGNRAAFLRVDGEQVSVKQFREKQAPYQLPNFQNVFEWSLPFVIENLAQLIISVLGNPNTDGVHSPPECHHKQILDAICEKVSCAKASEGSKDPCSPLPCSVRSSRFDSFLSFRANAARECEQGIRNLTRSHVPPLALNSHGAPDRLVVTARPSMKDEFEKVREADEESEQYPM